MTKELISKEEMAILFSAVSMPYRSSMVETPKIEHLGSILIQMAADINWFKDRIAALEKAHPVSLTRPVGVDRGLGFTIDPADWAVWLDAEDGLIHATPVDSSLSVKA